MEWFRRETAKKLRLLVRTGILQTLYPVFRRYVDEILRGGYATLR